MALRGNSPGRMDEVLTLYQPTLTADSTTNTPVKTFSVVGNIRGERMFMNSTERFEAQQQVGVDLQKWRVRDYGSFYPITNEWRFTVGGQTYEVRGIEKQGRKNYLVLTGEARDNG